MLGLIHVTEEKPSLVERFRTSDRHYVTAVEGILLEMAAQACAAAVRRSSSAGVSHVLRVSVTAPEHARFQWVQQHDGLVPECRVTGGLGTPKNPYAMK
jgi:hypothetical protein